MRCATSTAEVSAVLCVCQARTVMSQMVHVVSMLDVPIIVGSVSFQSNDVNGAQYSLPLFCDDSSEHGRRKIKPWPHPVARHHEPKHASISRVKHVKMQVYKCVYAETSAPRCQMGWAGLGMASPEKYATGAETDSCDPRTLFSRHSSFTSPSSDTFHSRK